MLAESKVVSVTDVALDKEKGTTNQVQVLVGLPAKMEIDDEKFGGFGDDFLDDIFPKVELKSKTLYDTVRELESEHVKVIAELLAMQKQPVGLPRNHLKYEGGSLIYIEKIVMKQGIDVKTYSMPKKRSRPRKKRGTGSSEGELVIDEGRNPKSKPKPKESSTTISFSQQELLQLRRPLATGWIRYVVLKSADGSIPGQVTYYSPKGVLIRSYKDLAVALNNTTTKGLSRANFSFTACPIVAKNEVVSTPDDDSTTNAEDERTVIVTPSTNKRRRTGPESSFNSTAYGGRPPSLSSPFGQSDLTLTTKKRRRGGGGRSIPARNTLMEKMQANDSEGGLFGISALSEIFAGMEKDDAERELEEYNRLLSLMEAQENVLEALDHPGAGCTVTEDGELLSRDEVLPCSIRCPGMTGKIPGLQCTRCLCLYHAECLGFSEDIDSSNFLCPNCEGTDMPAIDPTISPPKDPVYEFMHRMLEMKSPPSSTPPRSVFAGFGKEITIKKVDPTGMISPPRRRIPSIPQLTSHNLSITPLLPTFGKGQIPKVPNLSPMNRSSNIIPVFKRGRGHSNNLIDSIQISPLRSHLGKQDSKPQQRRYPIPNFGGSFGQLKQPSSNIFRNYPQSVVSVGQRKFIVIPRSPPPNVMQMFEKPTPKKQEWFGKQKKFIAEVFNYLPVRDLLKASHVNRAWRDEAVKSRLWTELRLKNTKILDVNSFTDFVAARGTQTIDFRKMLGLSTVSWPELFTKLGAAPALRTLILGSKAEELRSVAETYCPHLEVIDSPAPAPN